jgi:hypothetical protein
VAKHGAKSAQLTSAMVVRNCIRQSSKSGGRTLAKEFVNNVIVAFPLWKFDSGLPTLGASDVLKAREAVGINHKVVRSGLTAILCHGSGE